MNTAADMEQKAHALILAPFTLDKVLVETAVEQLQISAALAFSYHWPPGISIVYSGRINPLAFPISLVCPPLTSLADALQALARVARLDVTYHATGIIVSPQRSLPQTVEEARATGHPIMRRVKFLDGPADGLETLVEDLPGTVYITPAGYTDVWYTVPDEHNISRLVWWTKPGE